MGKKIPGEGSSHVWKARESQRRLHPEFMLGMAPPVSLLPAPGAEVKDSLLRALLDQGPALKPERTQTQLLPTPQPPP